MGLANRIVAKGEALERARDLAHDLARRPQAALRSDRLASYQQWSLALADALDVEYRHGMDALRTGQIDEGLHRYQSGEWR